MCEIAFIIPQCGMIKKKKIHSGNIFLFQNLFHIFELDMVWTELNAHHIALFFEK